ncbi:MAG: hypothetical protein LLG20_12410 [Acidobacteriales bacterium]|nr:hypothetical protein [Terriglobales bacterium]
MRKLLRPFSGILLVILGVLGLILPIMPGWVFLIPGLIILADYFPPIKRLVDWAKAKAHSHPKW